MSEGLVTQASEVKSRGWEAWQYMKCPKCGSLTTPYGGFGSAKAWQQVGKYSCCLVWYCNPRTGQLHERGEDGVLREWPPAPKASSPPKTTPKRKPKTTPKTTPKTPRPRRPKKPKHPAKYSDNVIDTMLKLLPERCLILDPFAGTGLIHLLSGRRHRTVGVEIEPDWASMHRNTIQADALNLPFKDHTFDCICTSPTYGNRFADSHVRRDDSERRSYTHDLGRKLHPNNSGSLQWGDAYRDFHERAWAESLRVLKPGGILILNISDHIRGGERMPVSAWHTKSLQSVGLSLKDQIDVPTPRMRHGENSNARVECEHLLKFENVRDAPDRILSVEELRALADQ